MAEPIRVLQMTASLFRGGSQMMITNLYKAIDRNRIQFDFIVDHPELNDLQETVESLGARVYVMPQFHGWNIKEIKDSWDKFFKEHPEYKIIHSHSRSYASIYLQVAKNNGLKTIIHSHNTSNGRGIKNLVKTSMQYPLRNIADYLFACSLDSGIWLYGKQAVKQDNFYILNNAIDARKFRFNKDIRQKYRKELNIEDDVVYIQVGEFNKQKNHEFTIELFREINKKQVNSKLLLVGTGEAFEKIKDLVNKYELDKNILLLGIRNDVNNLLMASDYYLMPSRFEGLSVAAIEAQASGIKCLLSDCVSKDVDITRTCTFISLEINKWLDYSTERACEHTDNYQKIIDAGYDVETTAKWLADFYSTIIQ